MLRWGEKKKVKNWGPEDTCSLGDGVESGDQKRRGGDSDKWLKVRRRNYSLSYETAMGRLRGTTVENMSWDGQVMS